MLRYITYPFRANHQITLDAKVSLHATAHRSTATAIDFSNAKLCRSAVWSIFVYSCPHYNAWPLLLVMCKHLFLLDHHAGCTSPVTFSEGNLCSPAAFVFSTNSPCACLLNCIYDLPIGVHRTIQSESSKGKEKSKDVQNISWVSS